MREQVKHRFADRKTDKHNERTAAKTDSIKKPTKKLNTGIKVLNCILAMILLVEFVIAGFKYSGFFIEEKADDGSGLMQQLIEAGKQDSEPDGKNGLSDKGETAPTPKNSTENHVAAAGEITMDFGEWNLDGADTLEVRGLGEYSDTVSGLDLIAYAFLYENSFFG